MKMGIKKEKTPINRDFLLAALLSKVASYYGGTNKNPVEPKGFDRVTCGGDEGSRTPVRKEVRESISGCSPPATFPLRQAGEQAGALVAS